ncbi:MAG: TatD family hydrolase [Bacteroidales bacterium]
MEFIDTHSHIYDSKFENDLTATVERAVGRGVSTSIVPSIDSSYHNAMESALLQFPQFLLKASGLHPTSVSHNWKEELRFALERIFLKESVAVGEVGIDLHWSDKYIEEQRVVFEEQIDAALQLQLPLIIHCRKSSEEIFNSLKKFKRSELQGVFHAFSGSYESYQRIKSFGDFKVGIGGVITFNKSKVAQTIKRVEPKDIVLETDSPWLTPVPYRGERNEPSYIIEIASKVAQLLELPLEKVANITTSNAKALFNIDSHRKG